jgi:DNA-directed RNA polymerase I, II, and III subunit RPABC2
MSSGIPIPPPIVSRNNVGNINDDDDEYHRAFEGEGAGGEGGGGEGGEGHGGRGDGEGEDVGASDDETNDTSTNASDTDSEVSSDGDENDNVNDNDNDNDNDASENDDSSSSIGGEQENSDDEKQMKKNKKKRSSGKKNPEDDLTLLGVPHGIFGDNGDNDSDSDSDNDADRDSSEYFQKLASTVRESYIQTYHPESMSHNYDEIQTLSRVIRNADGVIVDDLHRTIPIMTKYEKTRILGQRAKQLNEGAPAFIKIDSTVIDGYLIAVKELEQKKTPFIIRRPLPNGGSEYWRVQDLEIL